MGYLEDLKKMTFDTRVQQHALKQGWIKKEDVETHQKQLDDVASNSSKLELDRPDADRDSFDSTH